MVGGAAKCLGRTDEMFPNQTRGKFTEMSPEKVAQAKAICDGCPIIEACAAGAIHRREQYGIWGGLTPSELAEYAGPKALMPCGTRAAWLRGCRCAECREGKNSYMSERRRENGTRKLKIYKFTS